MVTQGIVGAALGRVELSWIAVATVAYWGFGMSTSPAWNAWVTSLVPRQIRARFFARRARASQAALLGGLMVAGLALEHGRTHGVELSVLSAFNLANAVAIAIGALVGAQLFTWLDGSAGGYAWLFAVSSAGRLLTLAFLRRTPAAAHVPAGLRLRTLAVRPSGVAVQRPILASVNSETPEAPVPRAGEG